jgi:Ca-activated chloride channel homolog
MCLARGAKPFLDNLAAEDMALVGGFAEKATFAPATGFTSDRTALKDALHHLSSGYPSGLYDALGASIDRLTSRPGRRVVVVMTDGEDNVSQSNARRITAKAAAAGVSVWSIGIVNEYVSRGGQVNMATGQVTTYPPDRRRTAPDRGLKPLSNDTGGAFLMLKNAAEWATAFATTAQALSHPYLVRFSPAVADGKRHSLKVRMKAPGHTAVAASSYVAPTTARP